MVDLLPRFIADLVLQWINATNGRSFAAAGELPGDAPAFDCADGDARLALAVLPLWEEEEGWKRRRREMADRIHAGMRGPYLLWVPPGGDIPIDEPDASEFVRLVTFAGSPLAPGGRAEVKFPAVCRMAKTRDEGGYASVVGGLARYWTAITERVSGTFYVDTSRIKRAPKDERERDAMFDSITQLSLGMQEGQAVEFELNDSWTVQRLREGDGFAIAAAPPSFDASAGAVLRRLLRQRLQAASETLLASEAPARCAAIVTISEFIEHETVSGAVRSLAPALYAAFDLLAVVADGDVKPVFRPRGFQSG